MWVALVFTVCDHNNDLDGDVVFFSSCRLHTAQRAIKQTQVTVQKIGKEIEEKLRTTATCTERVRAVTHVSSKPHLMFMCLSSVAQRECECELVDEAMFKSLLMLLRNMVPQRDVISYSLPTGFSTNNKHEQTVLFLTLTRV